MVRKTSRSSSLRASEKTRRDSPKRNHRRRSSSGSEDTDDESVKRTRPANQPEKGSSGNESDSESKKPLKKRTRSIAVSSENKDEEEVNEENISKGKSKSIHKSNIDNVNPETENENMQVTDESPNGANDDNPPNDDELSKNGMETSEIDVNISQSIVAEMTCGNQSANVTTEETTEIVISEHEKNMESNINENLSDMTQVNLEDVEHDIKDKSLHKHTNPKGNKSSIEESKKENHSSETSKKIKLNRLPRAKSTSASQQSSKEEKKEESDSRKKITLIRPESKQKSFDEKKHEEGNSDSSAKVSSEGGDWSSLYESTNKDSKDEQIEKSARKKITLKRPTVDEVSKSDKKQSNLLERSVSLQGKSERRKSSTSDNIIINERKRRHSSGVERSTSESEEKLRKHKKPTKVVKLIRKFPEKTQEPPPPGEAVKKRKWTRSEWSLACVNTLNLENLKEICSAIDFLNEADVDLEVVVKEVRSPEKVKRKTFLELEEEEMESIEAELNAEPEDPIEIKENIIAMNRKISIVEDTASKLKPPPSPARNPISEVLFITNLVRPFTVKQLKELLERTGKIREDGFWTDRIKSKCYVYYETAEEAESTRNALHGVHWPIGNGKKLIIDFATVEDMENAKNPPVVLPKKQKSPEKENKIPDIPEDKHEKRDIKTHKRDWDKSKNEEHRHRRSHSRGREKRERKHSRRSYTPEVHHSKKRKQEEPVPQKAMDDLFLKTKATPSIYWQPLSTEEIARKQQLRQARLEENKRRLQEIRASRGGIRDRTGRDRNFRRR